MSDSEFRYRSKYGLLHMYRKDNIVYGIFKGALPASVTDRVQTYIKKLVDPLAGQPWGYISVTADSLAATPEAEEGLVDCFKLFHQLGCAAAAYIFDTALARDQMNRARLKGGATDNIETITFDALSDAEDYIKAKLALS